MNDTELQARLVALLTKADEDARRMVEHIRDRDAARAEAEAARADAAAARAEAADAKAKRDAAIGVLRVVNTVYGDGLLPEHRTAIVSALVDARLDDGAA